MIPEKAFDGDKGGGYGYSLTLYAHYLSSIIDPNGSEDQLNSTIMREVWEDYQQGGTIFRSLEDILEDEYNTSFSETWIDFMSRNMFCGKYEDMNNDIYYHIGQSLIEPLSVTYDQINDANTIEENNISIKDDRVSIHAYQPSEEMMIDVETSSNEVVFWYGNLSDENIRNELSGNFNYELPLVDENNKIFFMFASPSGTKSMDLVLNITIDGCIDPYAVNYNSKAVQDDGSCEYPMMNKVISIFPNPINLISTPISINCDQVTSGDVSIQIFDVKGRLIETISQSLSAGRHTIDIDRLSYLSSGIYFLTFSSENYSETFKLINIR